MGEQIIIDGENSALGRIASYSAKQALLGKKVIVINSEKAVVSGNKKNILENYIQKRRRTAGKFPSMPEQILKRTIRGMLSYKQGRGADALKKVVCYKGMPAEFNNSEKIKLGNERLGISLSELSRMLRGRPHE